MNAHMYVKHANKVILRRNSQRIRQIFHGTDDMAVICQCQCQRKSKIFPLNRSSPLSLRRTIFVWACGKNRVNLWRLPWGTHQNSTPNLHPEGPYHQRNIKNRAHSPLIPGNPPFTPPRKTPNLPNQKLPSTPHLFHHKTPHAISMIPNPRQNFNFPYQWIIRPGSLKMRNIIIDGRSEAGIFISSIQDLPV